MFIHETTRAVFKEESDFGDDLGSEEIFRSEGLDYLAETDLTASNVFDCSDVSVAELHAALREFRDASVVLDKYKKVLFRKQSRAEAGLPPYIHGLGTLEARIAGAHLDDLFHGVIGVCTESGEAAEILLHVLEGRSPDVGNTREEIGDLLWYLSRLVQWADTTFLTEMKRNIAKLRKRHGEAGFDKGRDMYRDLSAEQELIRKGIG